MSGLKVMESVTVFNQAYQMRPSIIFFDEIDGLAPVRSSRQDQIHRWAELLFFLSTVHVWWVYLKLAGLNCSVVGLSLFQKFEQI